MRRAWWGALAVLALTGCVGPTTVDRAALTEQVEWLRGQPHVRQVSSDIRDELLSGTGATSEVARVEVVLDDEVSAADLTSLGRALHERDVEDDTVPGTVTARVRGLSGYLGFSGSDGETADLMIATLDALDGVPVRELPDRLDPPSTRTPDVHGRTVRVPVDASDASRAARALTRPGSPLREAVRALPPETVAGAQDAVTVQVVDAQTGYTLEEQVLRRGR